MELIAATATLLLGPALGSFFSVLTMRGDEITKASGNRSVCDHCGKKLEWYELLPLVSYIIQRGRCRKCGKSIDMRMFLAEIVGLILYGVFGYHLYQSWPLELNLAYIANAKLIFVVLTGLFYLSVHDLFTYSIPTRFTTYFVLAIVALSAFSAFFRVLNVETLAVLNLGYPLQLLVGIVSGLCVYLVIWLTKQKGMGVGDVYIAVLIGLLLGWPSTVSAFYFMIFTATATGLVLALLRKKYKGLLVPLVPFMAFGYIAAITWGQQLFYLLFGQIP